LPPAPKGPEDIEGELSFNTINYGVGNWHLYNNADRAKANDDCRRVVKGYAWNAVRLIGSELTLAKQKECDSLAKGATGSGRDTETKNSA